MLTRPSYYNDTAITARGLTTTGYEIYPLPYTPPTTGPVAASTTKDWKLKITLMRATLVNVVSISLPLTHFQLLSLCLTTVLSFLGIWRLLFTTTEDLSVIAVDKWNTRKALKKTHGRRKRSTGKLEGKSSGEDKTKCVELQEVSIRTAGTDLFDERSSSMVNPFYDPLALHVAADPITSALLAPLLARIAALEKVTKNIRNYSQQQEEKAEAVVAVEMGEQEPRSGGNGGGEDVPAEGGEETGEAKVGDIDVPSSPSSPPGAIRDTRLSRLERLKRSSVEL